MLCFQKAARSIWAPSVGGKVEKTAVDRAMLCTERSPMTTTAVLKSEIRLSVV